MPLHDALETASQIVDTSSLRKNLLLIAAEIRSGIPALQAITSNGGLNELIALTFANSAEEDLPGELKQLAELFEHRVTLSVKSASAVWTALSIFLASFVVGAVVIGMFLPLMTLIRSMSM
jgi:type II secretory pathway component PulF